MNVLEEKKERNDQFWKSYADAHFGEIRRQWVANGNEKEGQQGQKQRTECEDEKGKKQRMMKLYMQKKKRAQMQYGKNKWRSRRGWKIEKC